MRGLPALHRLLPLCSGKKVGKDARYLIKVARNIFKRKHTIIEEIVQKHGRPFDFRYQYTFFMGCLITDSVTLNDLINPYELFNQEKK